MIKHDLRGLAITEFGLGMSQLGNLYRETTDDEARASIATAWDAGVRYFDTAPHYGLGLSERRSGRILSERPRDDYVLSTKVGRLLVDNPGGANHQDEEFAVPSAYRRVRDYSRDGIRRSLEASLERLGTDRVDIVYLHDPEGFEAEALRHALPAMAELRDEGMVSAIGVGTKDAGCATELVGSGHLDVVMIAGRHTLLDATAEQGLFPAASKTGVRIVACGVYNSGLLAQERPTVADRFEYDAAPSDIVVRANRIADVCEEFGTTLPAAAISYCLRHPIVISVVLGSRNGSQAASNLERYGAVVPEGLWTALDEHALLPTPLVGS